jgi:hypothetical protein
MNARRINAALHEGGGEERLERLTHGGAAFILQA